MFPNIQWLLAAMVASILILSGGFGLFATLRLTHEPLTHLPPSAGPLQSFADNTSPAAPAAFESRFPADGRPVVEVDASLQAMRIDRDDATAPVEPPAPQADVSTADVRTADVSTAVEAQPAPSPDVAKPLAPAAEPDATDSTGAIATAALAAAPAPAPAPAPEAPLSEPMPLELVPTALAAAEPTAADRVPTKAIDPAEVAVPHDIARPTVRPGTRPPRAAVKRAAKQRPAAKPRRTRRPRAHARSQAATPDFAPQPVFQSSAFQTQPFQTQPFQARPFQNQPTAARNTRTRKGAGAKRSMGGPFVGPTGADPY